MPLINLSHLDKNDKHLRQVYSWLLAIDEEINDELEPKAGKLKLAIPKHLKELVKDKSKILKMAGDKVKPYLLQNHYNAYYNIR